MKSFYLLLFFVITATHLSAQKWLDFMVSPRGDTLNRVDMQKRKQGPWVTRLEEVRGEPGYEEQGYYADNKKEGAWTRFNLSGDVIAKEQYKWGFHDGRQQYFNNMGDLLREESWKAVNPANPYDTIMVPDIDHPDIIREKVIKHESTEVKHGPWLFYNPSLGTVVKREDWVYGQLKKASDK